ncbi:hypothetical protein DYST_00326 [Dyella terrae]|nr:hypothetical protein DYST_00326 [Dyella terrae]
MDDEGLIRGEEVNLKQSVNLGYKFRYKFPFSCVFMQ